MRGRRAARFLAPHLYPVRPLLDLLRLRDRDPQNAVLEHGLCLPGLDGEGQPERAREGAVRALRYVMVALLPLALLLLLTADRQGIVRNGHLDILLVEAGKFGGDLDFLIALADVDPGGQHSPFVSAERR